MTGFGELGCSRDEAMVSWTKKSPLPLPGR
jgi:hypothetical protein